MQGLWLLLGQQPLRCMLLFFSATSDVAIAGVAGTPAVAVVANSAIAESDFASFFSTKALWTVAASLVSDVGTTTSETVANVVETSAVAVAGIVAISAVAVAGTATSAEVVAVAGGAATSVEAVDEVEIFCSDSVACGELELGFAGKPSVPVSVSAEASPASPDISGVKFVEDVSAVASPLSEMLSIFVSETSDPDILEVASDV